jgi:hypothetical protein
MTNKPKPKFNKRIFWDVVFENIDYYKKSTFVEKSEDPISLKKQTWESVKRFISSKVNGYLK